MMNVLSRSIQIESMQHLRCYVEVSINKRWLGRCFPDGVRHTDAKRGHMRENEALGARPVTWAFATVQDWNLSICLTCMFFFFFYCGYVNMYRNLHSIFDGSDRLTMCGLWIIAEHVFFRLCSKPSWSPTARRQTHFGWQINLFLLLLFILHERMCFFEQACFPLQEHDIETPYGMLHVVIRGAPKGNKPAILTYHDVGLNRE